MINAKRRFILGMALALLVPGLGRALVGKIWSGILLFLLFALLFVLLLLTNIGGEWFNILLKISLWAYFASIDVSYVRKTTVGALNQ